MKYYPQVIRGAVLAQTGHPCGVMFRSWTWVKIVSFIIVIYIWWGIRIWQDITFSGKTE